MGDGEYSFPQFLEQHKAQLNASGVPPELWPSLFRKLKKETFDAGDHFQIICEETEGGKQCSVFALEGMHNVDEENVFLVDHAWTFGVHEARAQLESHPGLLERVKALFEIDTNLIVDDGNSDNEVTTEEEQREKFVEKVKVATKQGSEIPRQESVDARLCLRADESPSDVDVVLKELWKHAQTYTIRFKDEIDEEGQPVWYLMDEFGARIGHSNTPNSRVVPLFHVPSKTTYNVLFLTKPVAENEEITRDYADNALRKQRPEWSDILQLPWVPADFSHLSIERPKLSPDFFIADRVADEIPSAAEQATSRSALIASLPTLKDKEAIRVFADDRQLVDFVSQRKLKFVDDWRSADIVWMIRHFHTFKSLATENACGMINQFPYESCLSVKDLFAAIAMQENNGDGVDWFQRTFNLNTELPQFVSHFQRTQKSGKPNVWIVKPWNLARGMDMHVTDDVNKIIRLVETGPKIACEYITRPLLFLRPDNQQNVKFDLRFILFVNQFRPVVAYVYNKFWIRFALNEFSLSCLDDNETHFTVFNYAHDGSKVLQMQCEEFIKTIERVYPNVSWEVVSKKINCVLRSALELASRNDPPCGVAGNVQSRAIYGADVMLQWNDQGDVQPTLLECNYMPDCTRACVYYPDFADTVFNTMFLDEIDPSKVTPI